MFRTLTASCTLKNGPLGYNRFSHIPGLMNPWIASSKYVLGYGFLVDNTDDGNVSVIKSKIHPFNTDKLGKEYLYYEHDKEDCELDIIFSKTIMTGEIMDIELGNGLYGPVGQESNQILGVTINPTESEQLEFKQYLLEKQIVKSEQDFGSKLNCWLQGLNH